MQGDDDAKLKPVLEPAASGRAKCRGCARAIARGELRFGERLPNPFAEGETTVWFHPLCAAYKRPEALLQALRETSETVPEREKLERAAGFSAEQRRRPRIDGAERAPSGQAKCRHCHEPIARGTWRIRLVYFQDGRFAPGGFIHLGCRGAHFETDEVLEQVLRFSPDLSDSDRQELKQAAGS
ncbi:MAG TPA: PARP-type zinc finger-containing protein [Steroidobacteraceae bacterium]|nr:PARP-type zinc finger-containing protein [Steroidobacteraceae bacterium]